MGRSLSWFVLLVFSLLLVGFAPPRDPRVEAVVLPDLGGESIETAAHRRLQRRDGVVLVVAVAEHQMRIETGPDARRSLSDAQALRILDDRMRPLLREGRTDDAVDAGVAAIEEALARAPEPEPQSARSRDIALFTLLAGVGVVFVGLIALAAVGGRSRTTRRVLRDDGTVVIVPHVPVQTAVHVDTSGSSGFSGGGGASSSW